MKAITLWQPWATLLACGAKQYETRRWATTYRGPIAIHAAQKPAHKRFSELIEYNTAELMFKCLRPLNIWFPADLPHGCIIATAELIGCWEIAKDPNGPFICRPFFGDIINNSDELIVRGNELLFGDWTPGRYAWEFKNMTMLQEPIPAKGHQNLWNWEVHK